MLARGIEALQAPHRRALYSAAFTAAIALLLLVRILQYTGDGSVYSDFDFIYVAAHMVADGHVADAYDAQLYALAQRPILGNSFDGVWTYPPPFDVLIAPLAWLSRGAGFAVFMGSTLILYLLVLRRLAGDWLAPALALLLLPAFGLIAFGQNGFLTGALAGLTFAGLLHDRRWAGIPLGLMIIKPHLAIGIAVYVMARRDWRTFWTAAVTVALCLLASTLLLGTGVWAAFVAGVRTTSMLLPTGYFPLYRMVSPYSALITLDVDAGTATLLQGLIASIALGAVFWGARRLSRRRGLALAGFASLLVSPYAYDYDMLIAMAGLALLLPELAVSTGPTLRSLLYASFVIAAGHGLLNKMLTPAQNLAATAQPLSFASLGLLVAAAIIASPLWKSPALPTPDTAN